MMNLIENLNWRYATKKMNGAKVPQEQLDYILHAIQLSPSSSGLQPYQVFVITHPAMLEKLKEAANHQSQITDCSALLVFAAWDSYSPEKIAEVFDRTLAERGLPGNMMDEYKNNLWKMYEPLGAQWHANHAAKQAYIALGVAMVAAAEQQVDATPMEGFIPSAVDEVLGLDALGLTSAVAMTLGYRDAANDYLVNAKKVRRVNEKLIIKK
jgi:nitroreductase